MPTCHIDERACGKLPNINLSNVVGLISVAVSIWDDGQQCLYQNHYDNHRVCLSKHKDKYSALSRVQLLAYLGQRFILGTFQGGLDSKYLQNQNQPDEYGFSSLDLLTVAALQPDEFQKLWI